MSTMLKLSKLWKTEVLRKTRGCVDSRWLSGSSIAQSDKDMVALVFIKKPEMTEYRVVGEVGSTMLDFLNADPDVQADLPANFGECGGKLTCSSCQVTFLQPVYDLLGDDGPKAAELEILTKEGLAPVDTSRLCCQVQVTKAMDGLACYIPERLNTKQ